MKGFDKDHWLILRVLDALAREEVCWGRNSGENTQPGINYLTFLFLSVNLCQVSSFVAFTSWVI